MATQKELLDKYPTFDNEGNRNGRAEETKAEVRESGQPRLSPMVRPAKKKTAPRRKPA